MKPYNGGQWTKSRFQSFIKSALRGASTRWNPKWRAIEEVFIGKFKNPKTGRMRKMYRCQQCKNTFPQNEMKADHIDPVIDPVKGFVSWDETIERMFVEKEGFQAVCDGCHKLKTKEERNIRTLAKSSVPVKRKRTRPK